MSEQPARPPRPVVLCILDGWGHRTETEDNAIAQAATPNWDRLLAASPHALLNTSAGDVGLPEGQMGNSEVGHQNIGAGRVVLQDLPRIDRAVEDGSLAEKPALKKLIARLRESGGACHLMGLLSPGGVHAHQDHILALARSIAAAGVPVRIHAFLDGRDTPPRSAGDFMQRFLDGLDGTPDATVATVSGRYFAMDRDKRWDRVARAYAALVDAGGRRFDAPVAAIEAAYAEDVTDEFVVPCVIGDYAGMRDGDGLLMANFRADRAREILTALLDPAFDGFDLPRRVDFAAALGMVSYSEALDPFLEALFPPESIRNTLGEVVAGAGLKQLRIAETEKYAHVTFFLNGGEEKVFAGEDRILVPSPRVATYDLQPEMSAGEVTDRLVEAIRTGGHDLIVVNYANPDMVGHTGKFAAALKAVETIDRCLGRLDEALRETGGAMLVTADHGNIELMRDPDSGEEHTAHTLNVVPVLLVNPPRPLTLKDGRLADIAPTLLELMQLPKPAEMTGSSLIRPAEAQAGPRERRATA
ncbi:MAG TPA: 2,3-bisphosphoglycerate-independent phosphoglycerate mutase [Alphaproteobacteria bacterium]|nr:2,3-bisphosphoglycerate-independent phosphoglycerate mutase [Alphaproteobacteria bacterium]